MNSDNFFDDNPVIDDAPTSTLVVERLPTNLCMGDVFTFYGVDGTKKGTSTIHWRERLRAWCRAVLSDLLAGAYIAGFAMTRRPRR